MEEKIIEQLLSIESNKIALMKELSDYIDLDKIPYKFEFISCQHFVMDSTLKITPHAPETIYLIEGNKNSNELKMPSNGFSVTTILRGRKDLIRQYFNILGQIGTVILFIQPYAINNNLTVFGKAPDGGWHIRVATLKESDFKRVGISLDN
jgi:hypothetical protein